MDRDTRGGAGGALRASRASDGHLPTPLILASALAARTQEMAILLAAVPLPLWEPVRLAEEMSLLDLISRGRVSYVRRGPPRGGVHPFWRRDGFSRKARRRVPTRVDPAGSR